MKIKIRKIVDYFSQTAPAIGVAYVVLGVRGVIINLPTYSEKFFLGPLLGLLFVSMGIGLMKMNKWPLYVLGILEFLVILGTLVIFSRGDSIKAPMIAAGIQGVIFYLLFVSRKHLK